MNYPNNHIYSKNFKYTSSDKTDLAAKFEMIRKQLEREKEQEKKMVSKVRKIK